MKSLPNRSEESCCVWKNSQSFWESASLFGVSSSEARMNVIQTLRNLFSDLFFSFPFFSFPVTYGTRFIPSEWSWRFPFLLQIVPGLFLGIGSFMLPPSPRWLAGKGRDQECLEVLSRLRIRSMDHPLVLKEWLEIRSEVALQEEIKRERHPSLLDGGMASSISELWLSLKNSFCIEEDVGCFQKKNNFCIEEDVRCFLKRLTLFSLASLSIIQSSKLPLGSTLFVLDVVTEL